MRATPESVLRVTPGSVWGTRQCWTLNSDFLYEMHVLQLFAPSLPVHFLFKMLVNGAREMTQEG